VIAWYPDAAAHIDIVLGCDTEIQATNTAEVIAAYLSSGDDSDLVITADGPKAPTVFVIRPLTEAQLSAARRAKRGSLLGQRVEAELTKERAAFDTAEAERAKTEGEAFVAAEYEGRTHDDLTDVEAAAVGKAEDAHASYVSMVVTQGLVDVVGWPEPDLSGIRDRAQRIAAEIELATHILRITTLGTAGKEHSE